MKRFQLTFVLAFALMLCTSAVAQQNYTFRNVVFGDPNVSFTQLLGINNSDVIAGYHNFQQNQGFTLVLPNSFSNENFPNSMMTQVIGINNLLTTDGFYVDNSGITHGFFRTSLAVFQQGTYAGSPSDTQYRWMGSVSRDNIGDILLGYSESSSTTYPSIAVAGRVVGDPLGTLSAEDLFVNGTGSQTDTADRWGDYSTVEIDPSDNCTFFYTTEYYPVTGTFGWSTNVSSWKFPNCH